ncbi:hypothetical protein K504DRAFT_378733, partial [Pleomassaria siparia CBS 279.74]
RTLIEIDCLGVALGGCLLQEIDSILYLIAYYLVALTLAEKNYIIYNKELLVVLRSVEELFTMLIDYKNLEYFTRLRILSKR